MTEQYCSPDGKTIAAAIPLAKYKPEMGDQVVWVWANPSSDIQAERKALSLKASTLALVILAGYTFENSDKIQKVLDELNYEISWFLYDVLSKGPPGTQLEWTEVIQLIKQNHIHPGFLEWLLDVIAGIWTHFQMNC